MSWTAFGIRRKRAPFGSSVARWNLVFLTSTEWSIFAKHKIKQRRSYVTDTPPHCLDVWQVTGGNDNDGETDTEEIVG